MLDTSLVQKKLKQMQKKSATSNALWKPPSGKTEIRLLPYKFNKEYPFIELLFHYQINGKTYLSPATYGDPDPFVEMAQRLRASGDKESFQQALKLEPKKRTYVPMVLRGKESEGVKFWGFGKTVYTELLEYMADPEYGDLTDISNGRDITVQFKTAEEAKGRFPETKIRPKPNTSKLMETGDQIKALFESQVNINEIFPVPSYEDLEEALEEWLGVENESTTDESQSETVTDVATDKSKSSTNIKSTSTSEFSEDFSDLFESD